MGAVKICVHKSAKTPFYVESTGIHLYSLEELAFYLYENMYLIDDRMIDEKLYSWLEKELKLSVLAEKLRNGRSTGAHVYNQVMSILQVSEYYSEKELEALSEKIKAISSMQTQERMKYKADELYANENYWAAITEYERLLSIRQNLRLTVQFYAQIWNNLACCYAKLFLFEKAATCFENAYQFQKITEYKEKAYYARKLANYGQDEAEELAESKVTEDFKKAAKEKLEEISRKSMEECSKMDGKKFLQEKENSY